MLRFFRKSGCLIAFALLLLSPILLCSCTDDTGEDVTDVVTTASQSSTMVDTDRSLRTNITEEEAIATIDLLFESHSEAEISVYYENLTTGDYYLYNPGSTYCFHSTTAVFYADYLYSFLPSAELSDSTEQLLGQAVTFGDAESYRMLLDTFGTEGFTEFAQSASSKIIFGTECSSEHYLSGNVVDAAIMLRGVWNRKDGTSGKLVEMMNSGEAARASTYCENSSTACKLSLFCGENPFMLVCFYRGADENTAESAFSEISSVSQSINVLLR